MPNSMTYYIDCEFADHRGKLISMAVVTHDGESIYIKTPHIREYYIHINTLRGPSDYSPSWVDENVIPVIDNHQCDRVYSVDYHSVGQILRDFISSSHPIIIADSPVDIGRFCEAWSTGSDGKWRSCDRQIMTFNVNNVDAYPTDLEGAVRHNAWWDAMALRHILINPRSTS